jgi:quinol monooxygenase YgiN
MGKISVIATIKVKDGRGDDIIAAFEKGAALLHTEPGTEQYILHRNQKDPNVFYVTELYTDQAALDVHQSGEVAKALGGALGDAIESADLQFANPVVGGS